MEITLAPFGDLDPSILADLAVDLAALRFTPAIAYPIDLPASAYNQQRSQYLAAPVLKALRRLYDGRVLGVTEQDLYAPRLNFVFGLAEHPGNAAVISLYRLRDGTGPASLRTRILKEAVHEIGHTLGLGHCGESACVMRFSNTLANTDLKGPGFCTGCRAGLPPELRLNA